MRWKKTLPAAEAPDNLGDVNAGQECRQPLSASGLASSVAALSLHVFLTATVCSSQTPPPRTGNEESTPKEPISQFFGLWDGTITYKAPWWMTNRVILEIKPVKGHEVFVRLETPRTLNFRISGPGVLTPNCLSWVELVSEAGSPRFRRFITNVSTNSRSLASIRG